MRVVHSKRRNQHFMAEYASLVYRYALSVVTFTKWRFLCSGTTGLGSASGTAALLEELHRRAHGAFDVADAARILGIDHDEAGQLLGYLARRGWLSRVRRGLYVAVPLDARRSGEWIEDPWVVAERLFSPVLRRRVERVRALGPHRTGLPDPARGHCSPGSPPRPRGPGPPISSDRPEPRSPVRHGVGVAGPEQVAVSDPSRTVIDVLDDPRLGGGIRTVADVLREYLQGEHRDDDRLVEYGDRLGNRAVFKRLGYLLEHSGTEAQGLVEACLARRSSGLAKLDPSAKETGQNPPPLGPPGQRRSRHPGDDW